MMATKLQQTFTLDEIASLLRVDSWEKIEDSNPDAWGDYWLQARNEAEKEAARDEKTLTDEELDEIGQKAESEARDESYSKWKNALENAAEEIIGQHKLQLVQLKTKPWLYKLMPTETWLDAARCIVDTINGVGEFEFKSAKELADSIPTTIRGAVLDHLHWMKRRPEVYGTSSASRLMGDWDR